MNAIAPRGRSLAPFEARLKDLADPVRRAAAGDLALTGLPVPKIEAWHYTNLRALAGRVFAAPPPTYDRAAVQAALADLLPASGALAQLPRLVLVNGRFEAAFSQVTLPEGVTLGTFAATPDFGTQAAPQRDAMAALNTALAEDGVTLKVAAGVQGGCALLVSLAVTEGADVSFHPRHHVDVGEGASFTLIEMTASVPGQGEGITFHNPVLTAAVADGARLEHVKVQQEASDALHLATVYADIAPHAAYDSFTLGLGAALARHEVHAALRGDHAAVHVNGAQLLGGVQVGDITSVITHAAPDCISRQTVRNVLTDRARAVFQGKVLVEQIAQKTDGYQMNQALLLSPTAEINAKPELEIYADDVRCSHGATVGALDDDQLFYLRSRGIGDAMARQMLVEAFLTEALDLVQNETARAALDEILVRALQHRITSPGQED